MTYYYDMHHLRACGSVTVIEDTRIDETGAIKKRHSVSAYRGYLCYGWIRRGRLDGNVSILHAPGEGIRHLITDAIYRCAVVVAGSDGAFAKKAAPSPTVVHWPGSRRHLGRRWIAAMSIVPNFLLMLGKWTSSDSRSVGTTTFIATRNGDGKKGRRPSPEHFWWSCLIAAREGF
jgi:hypothetical protein